MDEIETSQLVLDQPSEEPAVIASEPEKPGEAQVVRLDAFRKKN